MTQRAISEKSPIALNGERRVRLETELGRGSRAIVYRGTVSMDYGVRRVVAVKVFAPVPEEDRGMLLATLSQTMRDAALIVHPNVVETYEFGMADSSRPYALMELVRGRSLTELIDEYSRRGMRMPLDLALFIGIEIAEGLSGARNARTPDGGQVRLSHCELAPYDVLLSYNGEVKVTDFGIGAAARAVSSIRSVRSIVRRARTMAPEVARGGIGDARSDVFSLGVILRELLIGPRFPPTMSDRDLIEASKKGDIHYGIFEPRFPSDLEQILRRALEPEPEVRYPHAGPLAYDLRRAALKMGVGDGRTFLKQAMIKIFGPEKTAKGSPADFREITVTRR